MTRLQRLLAVVAVIFVVYYIIKQPTHAAGSFNTLMSSLGSAFDSFVLFLRGIT